MSKTLLEKYAIAVRKRDKWAQRAESLAKEAGVVPLVAEQAPLPSLSDFRPGGRYYGLQKEVAKRLGVNGQTISNVLAGRCRSARIVSAVHELMNEFDVRIADNLRDAPSPLDEAEHRQFLFGGHYYGLMTRVGRELGIRPQHLGRIAKGDCRNDKALSTLRAEMVRVDAELAAKQEAVR